MANFGRTADRERRVDPIEESLHTAVSGAISAVLSRAGSSRQTGPQSTGRNSCDDGSDAEDFDRPLRR